MIKGASFVYLESVLTIFFLPFCFPCTSSGRYAIHDIYNNAYTHGGRLNVTLDRYFVYDTKNGGYLSESRIQLRTKYENRRNLSDITIRIGLIVCAFWSKNIFQQQMKYCNVFIYEKLVGSEGLNESASVLAVLQSDNDTTYETQSRHAGNVVSIVAEMLRCKYVEFNSISNDPLLVQNSDEKEYNSYFWLKASRSPTSTIGHQMILMAKHSRRCMRIGSIYRMVFTFIHWSGFRI